MSLSMYEASAPVFIRQLKALSGVLQKGQAFATEQGLRPAELLEARLAPDMFPLSRQVQIATDGAKGGVARLAGLEAPSFADIETSFEELQERIAKTIAFIESISADQVDGSEARRINMKAGGHELTFQGQPYLLSFVLPNFLFHVTTAYAILRHKGVTLEKRDFLGEIETE
jgi:hypothetical protein